MDDQSNDQRPSAAEIEPASPSQSGPEPASPSRERWAKTGFGHHKPNCPCGLCKRILDQSRKAELKEARGEKVRRKLKVRERRFVQNFADPQSPSFQDATKAALNAGYSPDYAQATGANLLRSEKVQRSIMTAMERAGITENYLAKRLREGLEAKEKRFFQHQGEVKDEREVVDFHARAKFQEMTHRLRGDFPQEAATVQAALILHVGDPASAEAWDKAAEKAIEGQAERLPEPPAGSD